MWQGNATGMYGCWSMVQGESRGMPGECRAMPEEHIGLCAKCQGNTWDWEQWNVWEWVQGARGEQGNAGE